MSLSRKLLESLGLESDKVSTIIEAHAETVDGLKGEIEKYKGRAEELESTKKELSSLQTELEGLKSSGGDWQKKYEAEHEAYESFKASIEQKDVLASKTKAYKEILKGLSINDDVTDLIISSADLSKIELEDGKIKGADELTNTLKEKYAKFIPETSTSGAKTTKPPANSNSVYTSEEIAKMTPEEINANWDAIKNSMKGNE